MKFFAELKRRNVIRMAGLYLVGAWLLTQVASTVLPMFGAPDWLPRSIVILLAIGFVPALIFSWIFELTPEGLRRDEEVKPEQSIAPQTARRMDRMIIVVLLFALGYFAFDKFVLTARKVSALAPPTVSTNEPAATANNKSIAVLPFANLSEEKANAYFADGIQDEILTRLSKIAELKVISRTSTQQFQSKPANIAEIAKQLGVAHLLEGSVQKAGDSVRVNVQLIKADGDSHLWAETYDRKLLDVFAVESEVAGRIASSLAATLTGREKQDLARVPTENSEAYDFYLRGLALENSQSDEEAEESRKYFRRAVELDPEFALAWAYLANHEAYKYFAGDRTPEQLAIARQTMESATKSGPETSESHAAAGAFYYYCLQDFERALAEFETARQLSPSSANAIVMTAMVKRRQGDLPKSIQLQIEAAAVDPRNADIWVNLGRSYRGTRQFREAREMYDRAITILPGEESILAQKIETYLAEGDLDTAAKALAPLKINLGGRLFNDSLSLLLLRRDFTGAIDAITKHLDDDAGPEAKEFARLSRAFGQVLLGDFDAAKPALETARQQFEERLRQGDRGNWFTHSLIEINAVLGERAAVERYAERLLKETAHDRWEAPNSEESVARGFAILRDPDRALPHLERALSLPAQDGLTVSYLRLDPVLGPHSRRSALPKALRRKTEMKMRANKLICIIGAMLAAVATMSAEETTVVKDVLGPEGPLLVDGNLYYVGWTSNTLSKWDGKTTTVLNHMEGCGHNGLALTKEKTFLLACSDEHGAVIELDLTGKQLRRWDADKDGKKFDGGINDIVVTANGGAYATIFGPFKEVPTVVIGKIVYLAPGSQKWVEVADYLNYANGIGISPDQKTLYVSETVGNCILKFTINADGSLGHRANFALLNLLTKNKNSAWWLGPDSMKVDGKGNLYVAQWFGGKVLKISPDGKLLHVFEIAAGDGTTNVAFGKDEKELFVTVVKDPNDSQAKGSVVKIPNVE